MNAADLFQSEIKKEGQEDKIKYNTEFLAKFRRPVKSRNLLLILATLFIFITIPLTVFVSLTLRDYRDRAQFNLNIPVLDTFRKVDLAYIPKNNTLMIVANSIAASVPKKPKKSKATPATGVVTLQVNQLNKWGKPIYTFNQDVEIQVNSKGQPLNQTYPVTVELVNQSGRVQFSLGGKTLLEVGL